MDGRIVLDEYKTQGVCKKVALEKPGALKFVPYCNIKLSEMWCRDFGDDVKLVEWRKGYKLCKAQKAKIKENLMPIIWHHIRMQKWCMAEEENKRINEMFT